MGNEGLSVCGVVAAVLGVKGRARIVCGGAEVETVGKRAKSAEMVKGGREEEHLLVKHRRNNGVVGRGGTTT
jgi:hypothetical protein